MKVEVTKQKIQVPAEKISLESPVKKAEPELVSKPVTVQSKAKADPAVKMIDTTAKSDKSTATRVDVKRVQKIQEEEVETESGGSMMLYVGLAVAATAAAGIGYYLMSKKK